MRYVFAVLSVLMLSGCVGFHQAISNISNKNAGNIKSNSTAAQTAAPASQCHNWCHNGWCSTHCENAVDAG